ncbi:MAG: type II toxin-antitoxin system VapC family toxin [Myxococcota bacterium]
MPGLLLDTHVLATLMGGPSPLSERAREAITSNTGYLYASAISGLELAMHVRRGTAAFSVAPAMLDDILERGGIHVLPVTWRDAAESDALVLTNQDGARHKDPFDRILVATALRHQLALVTADQALPRCAGLTCIW